MSCSGAEGVGSEDIQPEHEGKEKLRVVKMIILGMAEVHFGA